MPTQKQIREEITNQIVQALEQGVRPWRQPWSISKNAGRPANIVSRRPYSGINPLLLELHAMRFGLRPRWWATFRQWSDLGCTVQKRPDEVEPGRWGASIVLYRPWKKLVTNADGDRKEERFYLIRRFMVFSSDQVDGDVAERLEVEDAPEGHQPLPDYGPAEELIAATKANIRHEGNYACYCPPTPPDTWPLHDDGDYIVVPPKHRYDPVGAYYETVLHELAHWSEARTGWDHQQQGNAMSELVAEIAASFLSTELRVPQGESLENHAAYVQSWLQCLLNDPAYIFRASTQASKVTDYLLSCVVCNRPLAVAHEM